MLKMIIIYLYCDCDMMGKGGQKELLGDWVVEKEEKSKNKERKCYLVLMLLKNVDIGKY